MTRKRKEIHVGFTAYLKPDVIDILDRLAAEDYTSRTKVIERAVDEFLERRRKRDSLAPKDD